MSVWWRRKGVGAEVNGGEGSGAERSGAERRREEGRGKDLPLVHHTWIVK
jgi:hypothetical protein